MLVNDWLDFGTLVIGTWMPQKTLNWKILQHIIYVNFFYKMYYCQNVQN